MRRRALAALAALSPGLGACGDERPRQDAGEREGSYAVEVVEASFPERQRLARPATMRITVRNAGRSAIPDLAVSVDAFARSSEDQALAASDRPVWIVDRPPRGGVTAYTNTVALGRVPAEGERTFEWRVTPVRSGTHTVRWRIAAGLGGRARARLTGGRPPEGAVTVRVARRPARVSVDGDTGRVVRR